MQVNCTISTTFTLKSDSNHTRVSPLAQSPNAISRAPSSSLIKPHQPSTPTPPDEGGQFQCRFAQILGSTPILPPRAERRFSNLRSSNLGRSEDSRVVCSHFTVSCVFTLGAVHVSADPDGLIYTDDKLKLKFSEIGNFREIEENRSRDAKISDGDSAHIYVSYM